MNKRVIDVSCGDRFTVVIAEVVGDPMGTTESYSPIIPSKITPVAKTIEQPIEGDTLLLDSAVTAQDFMKVAPREKLTSVRKPVSVGASEIN
jgi:hypothetical protein